MSVVVCAYTERRLGTLRAAIAGARAELGAGDEVVVVVDHNPPLLGLASGAVAGAGVSRGEPGPVVRVIANHGEVGLSGARNTGVACASGELVAFLDDDAQPRHGWLRALVGGFAGADVIGVGGMALPAWEGRQPSWFPPEFLWVVGCSYRGLPAYRTEIRNPIGANMAFRRGELLAAGGFTDGIGRLGRTPLGCEETELSIRLRTAGARVVLQPLAVVDHVVPVERARLRYFIRRCFGEGRSKALISRHVGSVAALESERAYVVRTLTSGVLTGLRRTLRGDRYGVVRAGAILIGLGVTTLGYVCGRLNRPLSPSSARSSSSSPSSSPSRRRLRWRARGR